MTPKDNPFQEAHDYLNEYYRTHATTIKDVIGSQWTRGIVSARAEALNILKEAAEKWNQRKEPQ